jgi:hypothetical protein
VKTKIKSSASTASKKHEIFETSTALQTNFNKDAQLIPLYRDLRREPRAVAHGFGMCATDAADRG